MCCISFSPDYALFDIMSSSGYKIDVELQDVERIIIWKTCGSDRNLIYPRIYLEGLRNTTKTPVVPAR